MRHGPRKNRYNIVPIFPDIGLGIHDVERNSDGHEGMCNVRRARDNLRQVWTVVTSMPRTTPDTLGSALLQVSIALWSRFSASEIWCHFVDNAEGENSCFPYKIGHVSKFDHRDLGHLRQARDASGASHSSEGHLRVHAPPGVPQLHLEIFLSDIDGSLRTVLLRQTCINIAEHQALKHGLRFTRRGGPRRPPGCLFSMNASRATGGQPGRRVQGSHREQANLFA